MPVLKPFGGHLGKTTRSSVFLSKSYCEAFEIGFECSHYAFHFNLSIKRKYYSTILNLWASQYTFIVANGGHIEVTTGGHIGDMSGVTKKEKTLSFNSYPVNTFRSSTLSRKCQSSHFHLCDATALLRWYGRRWLQFPNYRCSNLFFRSVAIAISYQDPS